MTLSLVFYVGMKEASNTEKYISQIHILAFSAAFTNFCKQKIPTNNHLFLTKWTNLKSLFKHKDSIVLPTIFCFLLELAMHACN